MVLLVALGVMGVTYSFWSDTVNITSAVETGSWGVQVTAGTCSAAEITDGAAGNVLTVTLTDAPDGSYDCLFGVENTGSIPIKIQSIVVSGLPSGVTVDIIEGVGNGDQIDAYGVVNGKVNFSVDVGSGEVANGSFTVTISVVPWNQYVP